MRKYFLTFVFLFLACHVSGADVPPDNSCLTCHSDMWDDMKTSVHSQHAIYCNQCHGGDPSQKDKDLAKTPATGYVGVPDKKQIAQICGGCHADVEKMNFYGIPTDQLQRYKTSRHGKELFNAGNNKVAVCNDCHTEHDVVPIADPNSPVYPSNVPKTCNRCHGNEKIMTPFGIPTDIFNKYKGSVHGKALFEKHDTGVATCISCHGSHGAVPPGVKEVAAACGKCHINEKKNFLESPHAKIEDAAKFNQCISCHSNHDIQPPGLDMYVQACGRCHAPQTPEFLEGRKIWQVIKDAQDDLKATQGIVKQAGIEGIFVEEDTLVLEEIKTKVFEMGPTQHTLSFAKVNDLYAQAEGKFKQVRKNIETKRDNLKQRKLFLLPMWLFIFVMAVALIKKHKQLDALREEGKKKE